MPKNSKVHILIISPLLAKNALINQEEILANFLTKKNYAFRKVSYKKNKFLRILDIFVEFLIFKKKFDIVLVSVFSGCAFILAYLSSFFSKISKKKLILWLHGGNLPKFYVKHKKIVFQIFKWAEKIVVPSKYLFSLCAEAGFDKKTVIIPNIILIENYIFKKRDTLNPKLIWMRAFHKIYNPAMAIEVVEKLARIYPQVILTMAGKDKGLLKEIRGIVKQKGMQKHIRFVGFLNQNDKLTELSKNDIFINTSNIDNMPVSLLEAAALGLPIVSTNAGGIPAIFTHKETALLVNIDDSTGMAETIVNLIENPEFASYISVNARRLVENYVWENTNEKWENLFKEINR